MRNFSMILLILLTFYSCLDRDLPNVNGMWQLKTIEGKNQAIQTVDTIYYSFQRQAVFSYTLLNQGKTKATSAVVFYGYVNFPDNNTLSIAMDEIYKDTFFDDYPRIEKEMNFDILHLSSKKMTLSYNGEIYNFIKF